MLDQGGQQLQEARGLGSGVGVEQFLGLIHRQHQGGGGLLGGHIQQPGAGGLAGLLQPAPQPLHVGGQAGVLDHPQHRLRADRDRCAAGGWRGPGRVRRSAPPVRGARCPAAGTSGRRGAASAAARPAETTTSPLPDGPRITNSDSTPVVRIPRSTSRPRRIWASRPKNTAASASSSGAHPRYGARSGSSGGGHGKYSAPIPNARRPFSSRCRPSVANTTGSPPSPMSISVVGPSPTNRSQRCHSEVMLVSGTGSSRAHHDRLVQRLGIPELGLAFRGGFPVRRQQADHRLTAGVGLLQRLLPACPGSDTGVRVQIQIDLLGQPRLLLDQPRLDRDRLTAIPAGMTQKHPRHHSPPRDGIRLSPARSAVIWIVRRSRPP